MCGVNYPARWIFHLWRVSDGLLRVLILLIILNLITLFFIVSGKCMLLCLYSYLPWVTISALYYVLLYLLITCSPHLYTIGANKWWWWWWWWWTDLSGYSSSYCEHTWGRHCCLTSFFSIVDTCLSCEDIARQSCVIVPRWRIFGEFWVLRFQRVACSTFQTCILNSH